MFTKFYQSLIALGSSLIPIFLLVVRLFWGWQFLKTGLDKFADIQSIANYFQTLGIPMPEVNAYLAASAEAVGGLCLLIGFASRLAAIPLMITMSVALLTAHFEATAKIFDDPTVFIVQLPVTFFLAALIIFIFGPGPFSVDGALKRWREKTN